MKPTDTRDPSYFHKVVDCQWACPAHTNVPEYIRLIAQGRFSDAYMVNRHSNVFPGILGRVCDRPCEPACRRGRVEEKPVAICRLKRVAADHRDDDIRSRLPKIPKLKNGKKAVTERRFFLGYVLVEMVMDDDSWHLVKHTSKVTGFVGGAKNRPAPISEAEVMKIVNQMQEGLEKPRPKVEWQVGEMVRVKEGPFTDFNGAVEEVNYEKSKVKVSVTIFGRATGVELDFAQVEKV